MTFMEEFKEYLNDCCPDFNEEDTLDMVICEGCDHIADMVRKHSEEFSKE